jgi:hypothetical protein
MHFVQAPVACITVLTEFDLVATAVSLSNSCDSLHAVQTLQFVITTCDMQNAMALALLVVAEQEEDEDDDVTNTDDITSNGNVCNGSSINDDTASVMTTASTASSRMVQRSTVDCRGHRIIQVHTAILILKLLSLVLVLLLL